MDFQWLQVLAEGWASPLRGFMTEKQYLQCQHFKCLLKGGGGTTSNGPVNQSVPIVLAVSTDDQQRLLDGRSCYTGTETETGGGGGLTLLYDGRPVAILRQPQFYEHRKEERACRQLGRSDPATHRDCKVCDAHHPLVYLCGYSSALVYLYCSCPVLTLTQATGEEGV